MKAPVAQVVAAVEGCRERYIHMDLDYDQVRAACAFLPWFWPGRQGALSADLPTIVGLSHACLTTQVVVLETQTARKSTAQILELHGIPADRSPDLQAER